MNTQITTLQNLLRQKDQVESRTLGEGLTTQEMGTLFALCLSLFMAYGLLIGANYGWQQALVSAVKLPMLFLLTSAICFPTLYMFLTYLGIQQGLRQLLGLLLLSLTYISLVLAAFAPVTFFFLITTDGYEFYKFINILIFSMGGYIGIRLFYRNLNAIIIKTWRTKTTFSTGQGDVTVETQGDNTGKARWFLTGWAFMFAYIGAQLSYTLSPFFGDPDAGFMFINDKGGNFFEDVLKTITNLN